MARTNGMAKRTLDCLMSVYSHRKGHTGILIALLLMSVVSTLYGSPVAHAALGDWPTYAAGIDRSGINSTETIITAATAANLKLKWVHTAGGAVSSQPVEANGLVYWGSWDGYEHATNLSNGRVWASFLGQTFDPNCVPTKIGVASTATVDTSGTSPVLYVGGGNDRFYALNANTGAILWQTVLGSSPSHFVWSSPALYNGSVYIGNASLGDCPLVGGQVYQLNASTGAIQHVFNLVPKGCIGAGVWGSPTIDAASGKIYFASGNPGSCSTAESLAESVIELNASDMSFVASWQVRGSDKADLDFGSTPTIFTAIIGGVSHAMLGVANKDGKYYAFDRNAISKGPVWRAILGRTGSCPECGNGSISPSAWDGVSLYAAGGATTINGVACAGAIRALDPATGAYKWQHCLQSGAALGAVSVAGGVAFVGQGQYLMGIATATGQTLFRYRDTSSGSHFWSGPSISNGRVYAGNQDGTLDAFGL